MEIAAKILTALAGYLPKLPKATYDDRGGKRKNFGSPKAPHR